MIPYKGVVSIFKGRGLLPPFLQRQDKFTLINEVPTELTI